MYDIDEGESDLNLFDPENPDINLFNLVDDEIIKLSGPKLFFYKYHRIEDYDDVYMEARNKPIAKEPITVYGHYEPKVLEENLSQFGIELTNDQIFIFNKNYIEQRLRGEIIPGDVIKPKFQNQKYEIFEVQEDGFQIYGVYHMICIAKLLRDEVEVVNEPYTKKTNDIGGYLDIDHV